MPSFDVVSEVDLQEASNAVDQANREVGTRFDFKGVDAKYERSDNVITMIAEGEFQLKQMLDILNSKLHKRGIDIACIDLEKIEKSGMQARQKVILRQGIDKEMAKKVVKLIKDNKMKVQAAIQGEQVRVTGKKRDDLQAAIALLKQSTLGLPLQFTNFRD